MGWLAVALFTLRGIAWFRYDPVTFDSALYFEMAALMRAGLWPEALRYDYPPLYSILIAALEPAVGAAHIAGLLIAFSADLLILLPIVGITRRAVGWDAAWVAAFLWAVHPSAIRLGVQALSDAPMALCVSVAVYLALRSIQEGQLVCAWASGMASGLAFLFRPEGLEPAVALAAFYALTARSAKREAQSAQGGRIVRCLGWILAPLVGWAIVAAPYVAQISVEAGSLTLSKKKSAASFVRSMVPLPASNSPASKSLEPSTKDREARDERLAAPVPTAAPTAAPGWLSRFGQNAYLFQRPLVNGLNPLLMVLACVGWVGISGRKGERWKGPHGLLLGLFVLHFAILIGLAMDKGVTYLGRHHFLLAVVYLLPLAGAGLVRTLAWLGGPRARPWVPATALSLIVMATGVSLVTRGPDLGRSLRSAAVWIQSQVAGTPVIVTSVAKLTYHAHAERVDMGGAYDEILHRARERSAHFVALYPDLIHLTSPDFLSGLGRGDLELVKVFPEPTRSAPHQRLELYRLRKRSHTGNGS